MTISISTLADVPREVQRALKVYGISTCAKLLTTAGSAAQRAALADVTRVPLENLTALVNQADLRRINGLGTGFSRLLLDAGIVGVATLAEQDEADLHRRLHQHNRAKDMLRRAPNLDEVTSWIGQARSLPKLVDTRSEDDPRTHDVDPMAPAARPSIPVNRKAPETGWRRRSGRTDTRQARR
ncbi:MAG: DUF4332 domain-containing protein [Geminicoccaceae bacterium]